MVYLVELVLIAAAISFFPPLGYFLLMVWVFGGVVILAGKLAGLDR